ncbi:fluoride efflux transporter CrcB [soil metagenome]
MSGGLFRSILVFLGAGLGANARYWLGLWVLSRTGILFPWGTFLINVTGSFLIGLTLGFMSHLSSTHSWRVFLIVGFLGGYTTFSTFSIETVGLLRAKSYLAAMGNFFGSCLLGFAACWLGLILTSAFSKGR